VVSRDEVVRQLLEVIPILREEGWVVTAFNVIIDRNGLILATVWPDDEELGRQFISRMEDLTPGLRIGLDIRSTARHTIFKMPAESGM
jgi:hypothetical protein